MIFVVGTQKYRLRITEGPIVLNGVECSSVCLQAHREILIAPDHPKRDRLRSLLHELARAWVFETGMPRDAEGWMDVAASVSIGAMKDLNNQGGEMALLAMRPGESTGASTAKIGLSRNRECAVCRTTVAGASVQCQPAGMPGVVELALYCEFCNHTQRWQEMQSARGLPTGVVVGEPAFERGDTRKNVAMTMRG